MVMGDTGSERFFALITLAIREAGGDVHAGITAAVREIIAEYELYSLNFVLGEIGHIWAFRYTEHNPLHLHRRRPGGSTGSAQLDQADPGWEEIHAGELVHVGSDLEVDRETIASGPPAHPMVLSAHEQVTQAYH